jgi:GTP cyclohydrolase II
MTSYAFYRMAKNAFLDECLAIVCSVTQEEMATDGLQQPHVLLLLKSGVPASRISTIEQLRAVPIFRSSRPPLLRLASECAFGTFGDSHCECEAQRVGCLREIARHGEGIYVQIPQEAQGNGLLYKAAELQLQVSGVAPDGSYVGQKSVDEASRFLLGPERVLDKRDYGAVCRIFRETGLDKYPYTLITDSPAKSAVVAARLGIRLEGHSVTRRPITVENAGEYLAKLYKKGYTISNHELEEIYLCLFGAERLPGRVLGLLRYMAEDLHHGREFQGDPAILERIVHVARARGGAPGPVRDIDLARGVSSYEEYQIELSLNAVATKRLFELETLGGIDSLRYEENHFYDVGSFDGVPTRSLKIRYAYKVSDRGTPTEIKFVYKVPVVDREKTYRIRSLPIGYDDIGKVLSFVLRDYEQHFVPVFTHNVFAGDGTVTALVKRYSTALRTLSLMGPEENVRRLASVVCAGVDAQEIPDPSNALFLNRKISLDFDYDALAKEELALYRLYCVG